VDKTRGWQHKHLWFESHQLNSHPKKEAKKNVHSLNEISLDKQYLGKFRNIIHYQSLVV
jgi:hypothetical protein